MALTINLSTAQTYSFVPLEEQFADAHDLVQKLEERLILLKATNEENRRRGTAQTSTNCLASSRANDDTLVLPDMRLTMAAPSRELGERIKSLQSEIFLLTSRRAELREEIRVLCSRIQLLKTIRSQKIK